MGRMKTQWNDDNTLMQLLLFLFEMHTFGDAAEVPEEVWEGLARAIFEVENVILNPILTSLSSRVGFDSLKHLVQSWRDFGPSEEVYQASRDLLDTVVEPDVAGTVNPTSLRGWWAYLGTSSRLPFLMWMYMLMSSLWVVAAAGLLAVGVLNYQNEDSGDAPRQSGNVSPATVLFVNIVSAALMVFFGTFAVSVGLSVAHHNAVMHGIVNFMETRRFRDLFPVDTDDLHSQSSQTLVDAEASQNNNNSVPSLQGAGLSGATNNGNILRGTSPAGIAAQTSQFPANLSFGKGGGAVPSSQLPRFGQSCGMSVLHMQSMLGGLSAMGFNHSGAQESDRDPKVFALCNDTSLLTALCASLWKHRVPIVAFSEPREFAGVALRARHDRMRLLFIHADMITEPVYTSLRPMEDQCPQQLVYFSSAANAMQRSEVVPKHLITYGVTEDDVARIVASAHEAMTNAMASQEIMRTGKHFTIPHYNLGRRLGGGAFGNVFEAEMESLGGRCAVKRIYFKAGEATERLREIGREVDIMSRLQHANIVQYLFCRREGNCICIFMELCEGGSLAAQIQKRELTPDLIKHYLRQIVEAVLYLHENNIIHRDLKPENVLFRSGQVKLTDFGTATKFQGGGDQHRNVKGTFPFMAPEVLLQEPYGSQCDVWSIGCIAADMLGITLEHRSLGLAHLTDFFKGLNMMMAIEVDADELVLKDFIERCFCRDPQRRPTPQALLQHALLKPEDSSLRRHMEHPRNRPLRRQSIGMQSLRSMGMAGGVLETESEF